MKLALLLFYFPSIVFSNSNLYAWDGNYKDLNCGSAFECKTMASQLISQNRDKEAVPYMAKSCLLGEIGFCWLAAASSKRFPETRYALTKKGCDLAGKIGNECREYIQLLLETGKFEEAKATYKVYCNDSSQVNCAPILGITQKGKYKGKKLDFQEVQMIKENCKEGHLASCNILKFYPIK